MARMAPGGWVKLVRNSAYRWVMLTKNSALRWVMLVGNDRVNRRCLPGSQLFRLEV